MPHKDKNKKKEYYKEYYNKNKDKILEQAKKYRDQPLVKKKNKIYYKEYYKSPKYKLYRQSQKRKEYEYNYARLKETKEKSKKYSKTNSFKKCQKRYYDSKKGKLVKKRYYYTKNGMKNNYNQRIKKRSRSKSKILTHGFSIDDWLKKLNETEGFCIGYKREKHYVGIKKLTMDHNPSISLALDGYIYKIEDVTPLCFSCNTRKK
jgi:hypothetical protein